MEEFNLDLEDNEDEHTPVYDSDEYWSVEMRRELAEAGLL